MHTNPPHHIAIAPNRRTADVERFLVKVDTTGDCWTWQSSKSAKGYGEFFLNHNKVRRKIYAHRFAYELLAGPIPDGLHLDHLCRNPSCVRPSHLEPVTLQENTARGQNFTALNAAKTHCPQGHPYDEVNTEYWQNERRCIACRRVRNRERMRRTRAEARAAHAAATGKPAAPVV